MTRWGSCKARKVYRALLRIGWAPDPSDTKGSSHRQLRNPKFDYEYTWAFDDSVELGPAMLARIARKTGLKPSDL